MRATEEVEQVVRSLQAEMNMDAVQNAARIYTRSSFGLLILAQQHHGYVISVGGF